MAGLVAVHGCLRLPTTELGQKGVLLGMAQKIGRDRVKEAGGYSKGWKYGKADRHGGRIWQNVVRNHATYNLRVRSSWPPSIVGRMNTG